MSNISHSINFQFVTHHLPEKYLARSLAAAAAASYVWYGCVCARYEYILFISKANKHVIVNVNIYYAIH